jgi:hypothetical protein
MFFLQNVICKHEVHVLVEKRKLERGESMKDEKNGGGWGDKQKRTEANRKGNK